MGDNVKNTNLLMLATTLFLVTACNSINIAQNQTKEPKPLSQEEIYAKTREFNKNLEAEKFHTAGKIATMLADQGQLESSYNLGVVLSENSAKAANVKSAEKAFLTTANKQHNKSMFALSQLYADHEEIFNKKAEITAQEKSQLWLTQAAIHKNLKAMNLLCKQGTQKGLDLATLVNSASWCYVGSKQPIDANQQPVQKEIKTNLGRYKSFINKYKPKVSMKINEIQNQMSAI